MKKFKHMKYSRGKNPNSRNGFKKGHTTSEEIRRKIGLAKNGRSNGRLDCKHLEETKRKMSEAHKGHKSGMTGKKHSEETKRKLSIIATGKKHKQTTKDKISKAHKGYIFSEKSKAKISRAFAGEKNPNWQGGKSFEPYSLDWTKTLRLAIRQKDGFICQKCGVIEKEHLEKFNRVLAVHHIDYNKKNCNSNNLITMCTSCNAKVNYKREYWKLYFKGLRLKKFGYHLLV